MINHYPMYRPLNYFLFTNNHFFSKILIMKGESNMKESIKYAIDIIEKSQTNYSKSRQHMPIYMFTTENVNSAINVLNVQDKNILTVSASGDHIFSMLLAGASNIESYDINYFAKYYYYLKEASILALNYTEFINFFFAKKFSFNNKVFDDEIFFQRILPLIKDEESKYFWCTLFKRYSGKVLYNSQLFFPRRYNKNTYLKCCAYLNNEKNYQSLQAQLTKYNYQYYWLDVYSKFEVPDKKEYDIIYLSNIIDQLDSKDELSCAIKIKQIIEDTKKHLVPNGLLSICYLYCFLDEYWDILSLNQISNYGLRLKHFNNNEYFYRSFNGINDLNGRRARNRDALMLTRKK